MLKIDRTFVSDSTTDSDAASLVVTIITLAHNLRLKVMAEGVETEDQLKLLRLLKCDEAQGFLFDRALEPKAFFLKGDVGPPLRRNKARVQFGSMTTTEGSFWNDHDQYQSTCTRNR